MRELSLWGIRAMVGVMALGVAWPWIAPIYTQAVAGLTDVLFVTLHQPFSAHPAQEGIALRWRPLRYITAEELQRQMGYVDRFARQGLQGHLLITINALYMQAGALTVLALVWAAMGLSLSQRCRWTILALGVLIALHALNLIFTAHIEFQLRQRYLNAADTLVILQDPEWYLYYGLRPLPVTLYYLLPWLVGILAAPKWGKR